jgi:hypothetical protein
MALAQDQEVVQALAPHGPEEALAGGVLLGCAVGGPQRRDPARLGEPGEGRPGLAVVIADEVAGALDERRGLAQLLGHPGIRRVARHAHVHHAARPERDHDEDTQGPEEGVGDLEEVAGPDVGGVVAQERGPRLARLPGWAGSAHVLLHRPLGHTDVQLQAFAADALGTPASIRGGQRPDQGARLGRDLGLARRRCGPGFPPPGPAKQLPMPTEQRLWLHDQQGRAPGPDAAGQEHQQRPVS